MIVRGQGWYKNKLIVIVINIQSKKLEIKFMYFVETYKLRDLQNN